MATTTEVLASGDRQAQLVMTLDKIKRAEKVSLPTSRLWNYNPCEHHTTVQPDCAYQQCGGDLFSYQTTAVSWLYLRKKGLLADSPGLGKTLMLLYLLCMLAERGELKKRALIVVNTPAVAQWANAAARFAPGLRVQAILPGTSKPKRIDTYSGDWDVLLVGHHMLHRDREQIEQLGVGMLVSDDVDALVNHDTATHKFLVELSKTCSRVVVCNASQSQVNLSQLHASMMPVVGTQLWGGLKAFEKRYIKREHNSHYYFENNIRKVSHTSKAIGIQHGRELKEKLSPYVIRRTYEDLADVKIPTLMPPTHVWLEMYPRQRAKYKELQTGVVKLKKVDGTEFQKKAKALAAYTYGAQICAGMPAIGEADGPGQSVKLDWLTHQLKTEWKGRKVVVFIKNVGLVKALQGRLKTLGIGYATVWGQGKASERQGEIQRFWEDDDCTVMIGTVAMVRSLNLQVANLLVNVDSLMNPEAMKQLVGRVRRAGSKHEHVFVFNLFIAESQESRTLDVLSKRDAINSFIWTEGGADESALFPKLSAADLLDLIKP